MSRLHALRGLLVVGSLFVAALVGAANVDGATYTWNVNGGSMTVPGNWTPAGGPPGAGDTGVIGSGGPIVANMNAALAGPPAELQVLPNGTIQLTGNIVSDQNIVMMGGLLHSSANYGYSGDLFLSSDSSFGGAPITTLSGLIQNHGANAGKFIKVGTGTVSLSTTNTYTGGTEILNGTLQISANNATGTGDVLLSAGTLNHLHATLAGRIIANGGQIVTGANYNLNATIGLKVDTTITTAAAAASLSGVIEDEGATPGKLIKTGSGTYNLTNSGNTFSGGLEIQQGVINSGTVNGSLGSGGVLVKNGATVSLFSTATQGAGVVLESGATAVVYSSGDTITAQDGSFFRLYQDNRTSQNPVNISGTVTMQTPNQAGSTVQLFQGAISGTGKLVYDGSNDVAQLTDLQAVNTHQGGTEVQAGLLRISSSGRLPDVGLVQVNSGAKLIYSGIASDTIGGLGGSGTLDLGGAALTLTEGFSPGQGAGTLTIAQSGSIVLGAGSNSVFELGPLSGPNDEVIFSDSANLTLGGTLSIANLPGIETGTYTLIDLNGGTLTGSFSEVVFEHPTAGFVSIVGNDLLLTITSVTPIPEPSSLMLMGLALATLGLRSRRRGAERKA